MLTGDLPGCRFPLFTKGVETYRFEYGVYLLNKDIELVRHDATRRRAFSNVSRPAYVRAKSARAGYAAHATESEEPTVDADWIRGRPASVSIGPERLIARDFAGLRRMFAGGSVFRWRRRLGRWRRCGRQCSQHPRCLQRRPQAP